jgi:hypothetical protein
MNPADAAAIQRVLAGAADPEVVACEAALRAAQLVRRSRAAASGARREGRSEP